jgi:hypothetical protein
VNVTVTQREIVKARRLPGMTQRNYGRLWHIDHRIPRRMAHTVVELQVLDEYRPDLTWRATAMSEIIKEPTR